MSLLTSPPCPSGGDGTSGADPGAARSNPLHPSGSGRSDSVAVVLGQDRRRGVGMSSSGARRVPAPLLVITAIVSVQVGSAVARTLFDDLGAAGVTLLRLGIAALLLLAVTRPRV